MSESKQGYTIIGRLLSIILPICLIAGGVTGFKYFASKERQMKRRPPRTPVVMVETLVVSPDDFQSSISVMGTVVPDKQVTLKARVSGEIVSVSKNFKQGGLVKKGETLLVIDEADYRIEVRKAQTAVDKALSDLEIEKGSQQIAKEELRLINQADLGEVKVTDLALRKPQLIKAKAAVEGARADLEKAELNLTRTRVKAPFNALILDKQVEKGALVSVQGVLATLVNVDAFQVKALVPQDKLGALVIHESKGSQALVDSPYVGQTWLGKVVRITGQMSEESRMAGVIVLVPDPLGHNGSGISHPLLLQDHVSVKIMGQVIKDVFKIPRAYLRQDQTIWIFNRGKLEIRTVKPVWKEDGSVYIRDGLEEGDLLITSDIPAPVKNMALQTAGRRGQ